MLKRIFLLPMLCTLFLPLFAHAASPSFLQKLHDLDTLTSTIPGNGDVNPYGVAVVPVTMGNLVAGNVLVSNFNNVRNRQGTGTTIVQVTPGGLLSVFAQIDATTLPGQCPGGVGLTTALVALQSGFVIVGSLPTLDGTPATAQAGCLIILDSGGNPIMTLFGPDIQGPWDMTADDAGFAAALFVSTVLNGPVVAENGGIVSQGSVLRIILSTPSGGTPSVVSRQVIASQFEERTDPNALVIGPTGLGLGADGTLYVADTLLSRIAAIPNALFRTDDAGAGTTVSGGGALNQPLGLAIAPNGNILTVNGGDGLIVETTPAGNQVASRNIDVSQQGGGTLFGLAVVSNGKKSGVYFVDDGNNTLNILE
jgi:hypothetical protein